MKLGISIKIDVTKIDKARLHKGEKGTYLDLTTFIDTAAPGKYGDHGFISQSLTKEERDADVKLPILGNCKVFFIADEYKQEKDAPGSLPGDEIPDLPSESYDDEEIDDIPF